MYIDQSVRRLVWHLVSTSFYPKPILLYYSKILHPIILNYLSKILDLSLSQSYDQRSSLPQILFSIIHSRTFSLVILAISFSACRYSTPFWKHLSNLLSAVHIIHTVLHPYSAPTKSSLTYSYFLNCLNQTIFIWF